MSDPSTGVLFCCSPPKFKLGEELKILNALFTQPTSWVVYPPALLEIGTSNESKFIGRCAQALKNLAHEVRCAQALKNPAHEVRCAQALKNPAHEVRSTDPYVVFHNLTTPPVMSDAVSKGHIIQLYQQDFNYTFEYQTKSNGCVRWFRVNQTLPGFAYPLIDVEGTNITDEKMFVIGGYVGYIACQSDVDIKLRVTATFAPDNLYNLNGPFHITVTDNCVEKEILVAVKYNADDNYSLTPQPEFVGLADTLRGLNQLCPLPINISGISSPSGSPPNVGEQSFPVIGESVSLAPIPRDSRFSNDVWIEFIDASNGTTLLNSGHYATVLYFAETAPGSNMATYRLDISMRVTSTLEGNTPGSLQVFAGTNGRYNEIVYLCGGTGLARISAVPGPTGTNSVIYQTSDEGLLFSTGNAVTNMYTISPQIAFFFNDSKALTEGNLLFNGSDGTGAPVFKLTLVTTAFC